MRCDNPHVNNEQLYLCSRVLLSWQEGTISILQIENIFEQHIKGCSVLAHTIKWTFS